MTDTHGESTKLVFGESKFVKNKDGRTRYSNTGPSNFKNEKEAQSAEFSKDKTDRLSDSII